MRIQEITQTAHLTETMRVTPEPRMSPPEPVTNTQRVDPVGSVSPANPVRRRAVAQSPDQAKKTTPAAVIHIKNSDKSDTQYNK
jgi:cell division protein FtsN